MSFIVLNDTFGTATFLHKQSDDTWPRVPRAGILTLDEESATEFGSRACALRAITRTEAYMSRLEGTLPCQYRVLRLIPEGLAK